jgi:hypothetical protein
LCVVLCGSLFVFLFFLLVIVLTVLCLSFSHCIDCSSHYPLFIFKMFLLTIKYISYINVDNYIKCVMLTFN